MKRVRIDELESGMILAKPVYGSNECLLMSKGTQVNSDAIVQLTRHGIQSLWVADADDGKANRERQTMLSEKVQELLDSQFEGVSHNPLMGAVKQICSNYLIKKSGE